jgi:DNA primase
MAAERIGVDVAGVERALSEVRTGGIENTNAGGTKTHEDRRLPGQVKVEREALRLLLDGPPETRRWVEGMTDDEFTSRPRREVFTAVRDALLTGEPVSAAVLVERLSPDGISLLTELSVAEMGADEAVQERIDQVFTRLRVFRLERHIKTRRETLQQVNPVVDADRHDALFTELVGLEAERRDLLRRLRGAA